MKTFSKILSVILALSLVLGFALVGTAAETALATFTFQASSNTSSWQDGDSNNPISEKEFTNNGYTLALTGCEKVYEKGNDAAGRGFLKFGTSSATGTMTFTVPADVTRVEFQLAGYKAKTSKYTINGGDAVQLTKQASQTSAASEYDVVSVNTSSTKTITLASVSGAARMVLFSVVYYGGGSSTPVTCDHSSEKLSYDHDDNQHWQKCSCGNYTTEKVAHDGNATCVCGYSAPAYVAIADGEYNISAAGKYLASLGATQNYGYPSGSDTATSNCIYTVENATGNQFYLKDANGRYVYNSGTYKNFNVSATKPATGGLWAVLQSGNTQLLVSVETNRAMQLGTQYGTFQFVDDHSTADAVTFTPYTAPSCVHTDTDSDYLCDNGCGEILPPAADSVLTIEQAIALGLVHAHNNYTNNKYYVTGVITEVTKADYGNLIITDADGNTLVIYGSYSEDGSDRYDAMASKPGVGDEVTLYGIIGQYSNAAQLKNGWITSFTAHTCDDADNDHACDVCDATLSQCGDTDNDHACDVCDEVLSQCGDADNDHACDICDEVLSQCGDTDNDHACDICDEVLTQCGDADKDHACDVCDEVLSQCGDADKDHACDVCDKVLSQCGDADGDDKCDVCGEDLGTDEPTNPDNNESETPDNNETETPDNNETETPDEPETETPDEEEPPKTGDISVISAVIMAVLSTTGMGLVIKKKVF